MTQHDGMGWGNTTDKKMGGCDDVTQGNGRWDTTINKMMENEPRDCDNGDAM